MRARNVAILGMAAALTITLAALPATAGPDGTLNPGDPFPAWSMQDHTGATVRSADLAGKRYLLWFYPKALTSGCTAEGCALRDSYAEFQRLGVEVLGVSFDHTDKNAEFVREHSFPFRLLTDADKSVAISLGAADSDKRLFPRRISYLVGADGTVLRAYNKVDPATHARQVLDDLGGMR